MILRCILAIAIILPSCLSMTAYKIEGLDEYGDYGKFTLTVEKEYEFW